MLGEWMTEKITASRRKSELAISSTCQFYAKCREVTCGWVESKKTIKTVCCMSNKIQHCLLERDEIVAVAVGTALADRPPRRSERAELPHSAPVFGRDAQAL
jgi:hypothetical protein